jgi:hypothetical protein
MVKVSVCFGLQEEGSALNVLVYPNPSSGLINFELPAGEESYMIKILSVTGQEVYTGALDAGPNKIKLNQPEGVYYYSILAGKNQVECGKLVID